MKTQKVQAVSFKVDGDGTSVELSSGGGRVESKPETCDASPPPVPSAVATQQDFLWSRIRRLLLNYLRFISTPARQEAILKTTQYTLWLLSKFYAARGKSTSKPRADDGRGGVPNRCALLADSLLSLSGEISWTRYLLRCFGLPAALEGVESGSWASNSKGLGRAMAGTMVVYYPLENLAYLLWKAPKLPIEGLLRMARILPSPGRRSGRYGAGTGAIDGCSTTGTSPGTTYDPSRFAAKASAWSCRFWLAFIVLDVARSMIALQQLQSKIDNPSEDEKGTTTLSTNTNQAAAIRTERLQIVRNFLYMIQAIQWSLPNWDTQPWLPPDVVNGLCWLESLVGMYQTVRNFQEG